VVGAFIVFAPFLRFQILLTLPGMIDEPGSFCGISNSANPNMQRKHVVVFAREDLVANPGDQLTSLITQPVPGVVCNGGSPLYDRAGGNHLWRDQGLPDAEVHQRALSLSAPEFVSRHIDVAEAVGLCTNLYHVGLVCCSAMSRML
jgi:hypothetical protein